jgi:Pyruvate/2-oxoacid:ferredoxin oxidoreductase gamma subunit
MHAGLHATQKNDYPITVLRGHSISEVILDSRPIRFTGIETPDVILALSAEGVARRQTTITDASPSCLILQEATVLLPDTVAQVVAFDSNVLGLSRTQSALAALMLIARYQSMVDIDLLRLALQHRFTGEQLNHTMGLVERLSATWDG